MKVNKFTEGPLICFFKQTEAEADIANKWLGGQ